MGAKYEVELERAIGVAESELCPEGLRPSAASSSDDTLHPAEQHRVQGLKVQAGSALSSFDAKCWPLCFTEFFYGDCAPNMKRPAPLTFKQLFSYLMVREELEYSLQDDTEPYRAKAMCR